MDLGHWIRGLTAAATCALLAAGCGGSTTKSGYAEVTFENGGMVRGPRTVENVKANMQRIMPRIYYLYSEALGPDSSLEGTVHLRMEIDAKGRPGFLGIHASTLNNEELEDLILAAIMESTFDQCKEGRGFTEIIYPVVLNKAAAAAAPKSRSRRVFEQRQEMLRKSGKAKQAEEEKDEWDRWYGEDGEGVGNEW